MHLECLGEESIYLADGHCTSVRAAALTTALLIITFLCIGLVQFVVGRSAPSLRGG